VGSECELLVGGGGEQAADARREEPLAAGPRSRSEAERDGMYMRCSLCEVRISNEREEGGC
jgi:hypothetical protein